MGEVAIAVGGVLHVGVLRQRIACGGNADGITVCPCRAGCTGLRYVDACRDLRGYRPAIQVLVIVGACRQGQCGCDAEEENMFHIAHKLLFSVYERALKD